GAGPSPGVQASAISDAASGDYRIRRHGIDHARDQGQRGHLAADMPPGFPPLRDDDVDTASDRSPRFVDAAHLEQNCRADGVETVHMGRRITPKEAHRRYALLEADLQFLAIRVGNQKVDRESLRRTRTN